MATYLLAYHGGGMAETEKEQARVMAAWGKWYQKLGKAVVDGGNPIGQTKTIASTGRITRGGGKNPITGYTVIKAKDLDTAAKLVKGCPILKSGGSVEVCETFEVM
ncbi:MAG: hypothetical protein E6G04_03695 [Actinobacteria bacterium]|nr:MAG: hypothetical protein E6G04_03695 [Actinomycetota bacterium]